MYIDFYSSYTQKKLTCDILYGSGKYLEPLYVALILKNTLSKPIPLQKGLLGTLGCTRFSPVKFVANT